MGNVFTLESLQEEIEREYAPLRFEAAGTEFVLQSLLRIPQKDREAVVARLQTIGATTDEDGEKSDAEELSEADTVEAIEFVLSKVTAGRKGAGLVKVLNHDLLMLMKLLGKWTEATQPGEATGSDDSSTTTESESSPTS